MLISTILISGLLAVTAAGSAVVNPVRRDPGWISDWFKKAQELRQQGGRGSRPDVLTYEASKAPPWLKLLKKLAREQAKAYAKWHASMQATPKPGAQVTPTSVTKADSPSKTSGASSASATEASSAAQPEQSSGAEVDQSSEKQDEPTASSSGAQSEPAATTSAVPPQVTAGIPLGEAITSCVEPGTIALTFDDGPYIYTPKVLDLFKANNMKATFFVNGDNFASIMDTANQQTVKRIVNEGHLLAHHTYVPPTLRLYTYHILTHQ